MRWNLKEAPISSKSDVFTEGMGVYAAGVSVKVGAHYPGRSEGLLLPAMRGVEMGWLRSAKGSAVP